MSNEITHEYDHETNSLTLFIGVNEVCCWNCEDIEDAEGLIATFKKIFNAGADSADKKINDAKEVISAMSDVLAYIGNAAGVAAGDVPALIEWADSKADAGGQMYERFCKTV